MAIIMRKGLKINFDPNKMQAGELAVVTDTRELHATFAPGDSPEVLLAPETDGTEGQVLALEDGEPTWKSVASPTDAQVDAAVDDWLDEHPEATTTVQDGDITYAKLDSNLKGTVDDVGELKSDKADADGTYSTLTAGNLATEDGSNNNTPYLFRASGGGVRVGEREYDKIVGGTVAWNQLNKDNFTDASSWGINGSLSKAVANNVLTVTATADSIIASASIAPTLASGNPYLPANHVILYSVDINPSVATRVRFSYPAAADGTWTHDISASVWTNVIGVIKVKTADTPILVYFNINSALNNGDIVQFKNLNAFDLTQMFGTTIADYLYALETATAGAGIAKLKEWGFFSGPYYSYSAGELKSVEGLTSHEMVGFNQWDGEFENAVLNSDGTVTAFQTRKTTKNHVHVIPNTLYCMRLPGNGRGRGAFYDSEKNLVSYFADFPATGTESVFPNNGAIVSTASGYYCLFVTPSTAHWVKYTAPGAHIENTCINLSDPVKNGTYEPYVKHTYPLDSTLTLRGIPKLDSNNSLYYDGDTYESDGTVTRRYGVVIIDGTQNILASNFSSGGYVQYRITAISGVEGKKNGGIRCDKYPTYYTGQTTTENAIDLYYESYTRILFRDSRFGSTIIDVDSWNQWLASNPVTVMYELATSTSETAEPFAAPQIVDQYGTEEYVTTGIVPVGHETFYPENLRQKIEGLPWNFASLIAPTEVAYKATQNYTSGSLFIVNNILYKATANIANGGTITPGTNCQATTLAAVIAAL